MTDFSIQAASAHRVGDTVLIASPADRKFCLPGDDDPGSDVHGHLLVRSVEYSPESWPDIYTYSLAVNKRTPEVFIVPERAVEGI